MFPLYKAILRLLPSTSWPAFAPSRHPPRAKAARLDSTSSLDWPPTPGSSERSYFDFESGSAWRLVPRASSFRPLASSRDREAFALVKNERPHRPRVLYILRAAPPPCVCAATDNKLYPSSHLAPKQTTKFMPATCRSCCCSSCRCCCCFGVTSVGSGVRSLGSPSPCTVLL